jgi:23S rRNA pseudouridine2605 synthase
MVTKPLLKALTEAGIGPRRHVADIIKQGHVTINGETIEDFRHTVNIETDRILVNGKKADLKPKEIACLMLHKPEGVLSTTSDARGRRTVIDLLTEEYRRLGLYPAGRLDKDSTGLLLLTNDGNLTYRLTHPRFEHEKEYLIQIKGNLTPDEIKQLQHGFRLEDGMTHPAKVKAVTSAPPYNYSITIHEGRKRQVRRMLARLHHPVLALKRVRIGSLHLSNLKEGDIRKLTTREINALIDNCSESRF